MEINEFRQDSGNGLRITRVGTHGLKLDAKSTLKQRLTQHKGILKSGGGNHRGSIFRLLVGTTFLEEYAKCPTWGKGNTADYSIRQSEEALEKKVSEAIRNMPFLCLKIEDLSSPNSLRGFIERNAIALLSNYQKPILDNASTSWRGHLCNRPKVQLSGLWNQNHVDEDYDPCFLNTFETLINEMRPTL